MQSNRLALVAPLSVLLAAGGAINFACSNSDDDNNNSQADSGVYIDGGIQEGVPPGSGTILPSGDDDDDDDSGPTGTGDSGPTGSTDSGPMDGSPIIPPTDSGTDSGPPAPTKLAVLRLGDGTTALPTSAETTAATFIDFYSIAGGAATGTSVSFGTSFSVIYAALGGGLALSTDGHYLAVGGYNSAPGTANAATLVRSIARVNAAGTADTTTICAAFTGSTSAYIRDVASVNGSGFWVTGTGTPDGTYYIPFGDTGAGGVEVEQAIPNPGTTRDVGIFAGQLYVSAQTTTAPVFTGVGSLGTGTPTTAVNTPTITVNDGTTGDPEGFVGFDTDTTAGVDTVYLADGTTGLRKFKLTAGAFAEVGTVVAIGTGGARAVTGYLSGTSIKLFATSADGLTISAVSDTTTSTTNGTATLLVTAGTKTSLRGIALAAD